MKKSIIIGILVVIALILAGGFLFWRNQVRIKVSQEQNQIENQEKNQQKQEEKQKEQEEQEEVEQILKNKLDTSDWVTYRNNKYGFKFKHPKDWKQDYSAKKDSPEDGITFFTVGLISQKIIENYSNATALINANKGSLEDLLSDPNYYWNKYRSIEKEKEVLIGSIKAKKVIWEGNPSRVFYVQKPNQTVTIEFSLYLYDNNSDVFNNIISTLEFTEN